MKWFRIPKEETNKPTKGTYSDWKEALSIEGKQQCVYCAINIKSFGGLRNFHVEHYKPKDKKYFPELTNEFSNLFFSCSICNCFKGNDWHDEPTEHLGGKFYPDPSVINYSDFLTNDCDFVVQSDSKTGNYIINKIYLNRPQLVMERRSKSLHMELLQESEELRNVLLSFKETDSENPLLAPFISVVEAEILLIKEKFINPYFDKDIKR